MRFSVNSNLTIKKKVYCSALLVFYMCHEFFWKQISSLQKESNVPRILIHRRLFNAITISLISWSRNSVNQAISWNLTVRLHVLIMLLGYKFIFCHKANFEAGEMHVCCESSVTYHNTELVSWDAFQECWNVRMTCIQWCDPGDECKVCVPRLPVSWRDGPSPGAGCCGNDTEQRGFSLRACLVKQWKGGKGS